MLVTLDKIRQQVAGKHPVIDAWLDVRRNLLVEYMQLAGLMPPYRKTLPTKEELSDFLWYFCNYKNFRGYSEYNYEEQEPMSNPMIIYKLYDRVSQLQDLIKKFVAYNKEINTEVELFLLNKIYHYILTIAYSYNADIEEGLEKNIAKLKARYPEKFDENLAVNRDLETERKILEGDKISN